MNGDNCDPLRLIRVGLYWSYIDAWIVRNLLVDNGIPAVVTDEFFATIKWIMANAVGGIQVSVREEDFEIAHEIVTQPPSLAGDEAEHHQAEDASQHDDSPVIDDLADEEREEDPGTQVVCPACHSTNACSETFERRIVFLFFLFTGFPVPIRSGAVLCFDCGERSGPPPAFGTPQFHLWHLMVLVTACAVFFGLFQALNFDTIARIYDWINSRPIIIPCLT